MSWMPVIIEYNDLLLVRRWVKQSQQWLLIVHEECESIRLVTSMLPIRIVTVSFYSDVVSKTRKKAQALFHHIRLVLVYNSSTTTITTTTTTSQSTTSFTTTTTSSTSTTSIASTTSTSTTTMFVPTTSKCSMESDELETLDDGNCFFFYL